MIDKPRVLVSKCLGFCECRYDGEIFNDKFVKSLEPYVDFIQVCPEVDIGLGVPRDTVKMVLIDGEYELYQDKTERIVTPEMDEYSHEVLAAIPRLEGAILKGRSPTCGIKDVRMYNSLVKGASSSKGVGRFAEYVYDYFPYAAIEEEGRLTNLSIREHFLIKLFTNLRFNKLEGLEMKDLIEFHARHKYLFMTYSQPQLKKMGNLVANHDRLDYDEIIKLYRKELGIALAEPASINNSINSLMHILGYYSDELIPEEKEFILDSFEKLKEGKYYLSVPINIMKGYAIKYKQDYLLDQYIWEPFPDNLLDIRDTGNK